MSEILYMVSSSPHIRAKKTVKSVMRDVIIALLPAAFAAVYFFGFYTLAVMLVSIFTCVFCEWFWENATHRKVTIGDLSAVVTGLLLAFNLPPTVPLWVPILGGAFAIIIVKEFFGGIGQNIVNPALAGRAFLLASFPDIMTKWTLDGVTTATPLSMLKAGKGMLPPLSSVFLGHMGGCIGEVSALALLIGAAYLFVKRIISWHIPVAYIGTVFVLTWIIGRNGAFTGDAFYEIFLGGLMLGAFFMATDYTTSPITNAGKLIFGVGCGILTTVIRIYGGYPEGVSYSILIMNIFVPLIDRFINKKSLKGVKQNG